MLKNIYSRGEQLGIPKKVIRELLKEYKNEFGKRPESFVRLIEGVCE
jgi:hypothetical protein